MAADPFGPLALGIIALTGLMHIARMKICCCLYASGFGHMLFGGSILSHPYLRRHPTRLLVVVLFASCMSYRISSMLQHTGSWLSWIVYSMWHVCLIARRMCMCY